MYSFNNCVSTLVFLIFHFETGSNRNWRPKNEELSHQIVASQIGKENRGKKQELKNSFKGTLNHIVKWFHWRRGWYKTAEKKVRKPEMSFFLSERYRKPAVASFLGDVKPLKKTVQGFESNTDAVERPPSHLYFHLAQPSHTAVSSVFWPSFLWAML